MQNGTIPTISELLRDLDQTTEKVESILLDLGRIAPKRGRLRRLSKSEGPGSAVSEELGLVDALSGATDSSLEELMIDPLIDDSRLDAPKPTSIWPALIQAAQLGQVLAALPAPVRSGFLRSALLGDVAMSARLDHQVISSWELVAADLDAYAGAPPIEILASLRLLNGSRAAYRLAGSLFRPGRIELILRRPHLAGLRDMGDDLLSQWMDERGFDPDDVRDLQRRLFSPALIEALRRLDPLTGALAWLWLWHRTGAASIWTGAAGRILANRWLFERGLFPAPLPFLASAFQGAASSYRPWSTGWLQGAVPALTQRLAGLRDGLGHWEAAWREQRASAGRRASRLRAIDAMTSLGVVSVAELAREAGLSWQGAQYALDWMVAGRYVEPVFAERRRWRLYRLRIYATAWPVG